MVDDLVKACDTEKIIVLFSENPDLVSNIYTVALVLFAIIYLNELFGSHCRYANNESYSRAVEDFDVALKLDSQHLNAKKYMCETLLAHAQMYVLLAIYKKLTTLLHKPTLKPIYPM